MNDQFVPFHRAYLSGHEAGYLAESLASGHFDHKGLFLKKCAVQLSRITGAKNLVLTPSCTAALEMAALLCDIQQGDEVVMPSFTFVSTANPFVLRGARVVFADIDPRTMNIDPDCVEAAITEKTKALVCTHYGGVAADLEKCMSLAEKHGLLVVEDAAHGIGATWQGRHLGTIGHLGALSFHSTKNIHCAEGGALLVNDPSLVERAHWLRDKGTNRSQFMSGQVDQYTWVDVGSSFTLAELNAAFLSAQLQDLATVNAQRLQIWQLYHEQLAALAEAGCIELARLPDHTGHNAHVFFIKCQNRSERTALTRYLSARGVEALFHYVPLHTAPAGMRYGRFSGQDLYSTADSERLLRLPVYPGLADAAVRRIAELVHSFYASIIVSQHARPALL